MRILSTVSGDLMQEKNIIASNNNIDKFISLKNKNNFAVTQSINDDTSLFVIEADIHKLTDTLTIIDNIPALIFIYSFNNSCKFKFFEIEIILHEKTFNVAYLPATYIVAELQKENKYNFLLCLLPINWLNDIPGAATINKFKSDIENNKPSLLWKDFVFSEHPLAEMTRASVIKEMILTAKPYKSKRKKVSIKDAQQIYVVRKYIDKNIHEEKLTIKKITQATGVSKNIINEYFEPLTNATIHKYIIKKRINLALILLLDNEKKIETIAESLGMSRKTFNEWFKKIHKISPAQFRKNKNTKIHFD